MEEVPQKPKKVKGAWHDPRFTKITYTIRERRKINKAERQRKRLGRT